MSRVCSELYSGSEANGFADIIALAQDMLCAAQAGDWADVARCEALRRERIAAVFPPAAQPQTVADAVRCVEALLNIDRQVIELARGRMGALSTELDALQRGRRAQQAYGQAAPGR